MSKSWPLFVYLRPFLVKISIQIEKSTDGVLGIRTRGRRRNHGAMAATHSKLILSIVNYDFLYSLVTLLLKN